MNIFFADMKLNWQTKIVGQKVILVPYCEKHVPEYHEWMKSPELQRLTGSEPLTYEEELEMQKSWRDSEDKCTFIILHKSTFETEKCEIKAMIGDTNIFTNEKVGEAEIMIAKSDFRGQKLGWEAMILMLLYGAKNLKIDKYEAKIKLDNDASIKMFEKLRFVQTSKSEVFQEVTLEVEINEPWIAFLEQNVNFVIENYKHE